METQNISGPDNIPKGFTVNSQLPNESVNQTRIIDEETAERHNSTEPNKGNIIDTYV